jgi:hypothetical protein
MDQRDLEAMRRAIETLRGDSELGDSIAAMLQNQSEQEVGLFASTILQLRALRLRPWEATPAESFNVADPSDHFGCRPNEVALLRKMLALGISRYDPTPLAAIEHAERERAA